MDIDDWNSKFIFCTVGNMFESVLRFAGLVSDSQEEARSNMQNHLIPFLVFIEEVKIQLREFFTGFLEGAWSAFSGGLAAAKPFVSSLGTCHVIFPIGKHEPDRLDMHWVELSLYMKK